MALACAGVISPECYCGLSSGFDCGKECGGNPCSTHQAALRDGLRRLLDDASIPVRRGNRTLGRFDSGAAPLSRFWRVRAGRGGLERPGGRVRSSVQVRSRPQESGENYRAISRTAARLGLRPSLRSTAAAHSRPPPSAHVRKWPARGTDGVRESAVVQTVARLPCAQKNPCSTPYLAKRNCPS